VEPAAAAAIAARAIGIVRCAVTRPRPDGWEAVTSVIELTPDLAPGLQGLDGFSHLIVLTWLHLAAGEPERVLAIHPGGDDRRPLLGVFALRVAGRPNPIGCSAVRLLDVSGARVRVKGLDAIDGTPVLDLKPYLPPYDCVPEARLPPWALSG